MKKIVCFLIFATTLVGCTSQQISKTGATDILAPAMGAAGVAGGLYAGKDKDIGTQMAYAVGGGAAGFLVGQFIKSGFEDEKFKEFQAGYNLGRSNSAKELYWAYQKLHQAQQQEPRKYKIYELPAPYPADGIKRVPSSIELPVLQ